MACASNADDDYEQLKNALIDLLTELAGSEELLLEKMRDLVEEHKLKRTITTPQDLFSLLEESKLISESDLSFLNSWIGANKWHQTRAVLNQYYEIRKGRKHPKNNLSLSKCVPESNGKSVVDLPKDFEEKLNIEEGKKRKDDRVTNADQLRKDFQDIASRIGLAWRDLARNLGLHDCEMESIEYENLRSSLGLKEHAISVFRKWQEGNGQDATRSALCQALERSGKRDLAEELKQMGNRE